MPDALRQTQDDLFPHACISLYPERRPQFASGSSGFGVNSVPVRDSSETTNAAVGNRTTGGRRCRQSLISDNCSTVWFMAYAHDSLYDFTAQGLAGTLLTSSMSLPYILDD